MFSGVVEKWVVREQGRRECGRASARAGSAGGSSRALGAPRSLFSAHTNQEASATSCSTLRPCSTPALVHGRAFVGACGRAAMGA